MHHHQRPPKLKPAPMSISQLRSVIEQNPEVGPQGLRMGDNTREPLGLLDPSLHHAGRIKYHRLKIQHKIASQNKFGVRNSSGAFHQLMKEIKTIDPSFIVEYDPGHIITLQSKPMKALLHEGASTLQSDTVEGAIADHDYPGNVDVHFTSIYDQLLHKWNPVLISIIFGRTKEHFANHWSSLLNSLSDDVNANWKSFSEKFPGVTMDWSDAMGQSFLDALMRHAAVKLGKKDITREETRSFSRKCYVHFKRSFHRVLSNGSVVPKGKEHKLERMVEKLMDSETNFHSFQKTVKSIVRQFPKTTSWIMWYLHPDRATSFFPACQNFNEKEEERFNSMVTSTNAQENVGKRYQALSAL